ncbi:hypothetical protein AB0C07_01310 [Actinoplanes missouriensis]|uniref:hypothetical protein n=1 Tax=Actinoplanes missouriensis TaxID=1866 RepID=UPI0033FAB0AD
MKLNTMTVPSMLPTAARMLCPVMPAPLAVPAAERFVAPLAHQALAQSELGKAVLVLVDGNKGTTGFTGSNAPISRKRYTDGGSGVPPRGRPV